MSAPEPSDIIWENLETSKTTRTIRQMLTYGIMLLLLLGSIIGLAVAQVQHSPAVAMCVFSRLWGAAPSLPLLLVCARWWGQNKKAAFQSRVPNLGICSTVLPNIAYNTSYPPADAVLQHMSTLDPLCGAGAFYVDFSTANTSAHTVANWGGCPPPVAPRQNARCVTAGDLDPIQDQCVPGYGRVTFMRGWIVGCFCVKVRAVTALCGGCAKVPFRC